MLCLCWTDSSDSAGLGQDLTAAFVTEPEEGLTTARGYNDTLQATIIHSVTAQVECSPMVGSPTIN